MDPATVAGLVLGIAPLIISAVESYEVIFQPFITYRRYSEEISKFAARLDTQKAIFNNQCQLLFLAAERNGSQEDVILDNILKDPGHPSRRNEALNDRLEDLLGASLDTCVSTLRLIHQTLAEIILETKGFEDLYNKKPGERFTLRHFKSKIKISFSKTRLNDIVNELRLYNDDLRVLSKQVSAVSSEKKMNQSALPPLLVDLQTTQQASKKLHGLLVARWVCNTQVDHAANLSLDVQRPQQCNHPGTRFCLSMTCTSEGSTSANDAVWVNIESKRREADVKTGKPGLKVTENMLNLTSSLKDLGFVSRQTDKPSSSSHTPLGTLGGVPAAATFPPQIEKLCSYFHSKLQQMATLDNNAIYYETTNTFDHFVYRCPCPPGFVNKSLSLKQILQENADQRKREPRISKFKLAKLLALGVLRFQSTPWVRETLNSEDIHFLVSQSDLGGGVYSLEDPFIRVQLSRKTGNRLLTAKSGARGLSRNELLFNLGVILLELGYDAPLQYLRSTKDIKEGEAEANRYTDFFTARRLGQSALSQLDARYGKLAKKCVECDFGVGEDLDSIELQSAVLRDVVTELDKCIKLEERINSILP